MTCQEAPVWEIDPKIEAFNHPGGKTTVYYLTRAWPDGGRENAILVERSGEKGRVSRWLRTGDSKNYFRLLKR